MPTKKRLVGRALATHYEFEAEPTWAPLAAVSRLARESPELPSFHEAEFMYMGCVRHDRTGVAIHLYKHRDTRRYINLDDAGHAYAYCPTPLDGREPGGMYRRHRSLADALDAVELSLFDEHPRFFRSFPPEEWPADTESDAV
jgi:hypothetical protein